MIVILWFWLIEGIIYLNRQIKSIAFVFSFEELCLKRILNKN